MSSSKPKMDIAPERNKTGKFSANLSYSLSGEAGLKKQVRGVLAFLFVSAIGMLGMWQVYHSQLSSGFDLFPGPRGDTRLSAYLIEHWYQVLSGHGDLLSPAMFYPVKGTLGFTDTYLGFVPSYSLLRVSGYDIFSALSVTVILLNFLNFISCFVFLNRVLKFNAIASCTGAMFFAFNNPKLAQGDHLQLQPVFLLPIIAGSIIQFFSKGKSLSSRQAFGLLTVAALCLNLQLFTSFYIGWFFVFWSFLLLSVSLLFRQARLFILETIRRHWVSLTGAIVVFVVGFVSFLVVYLPAVSSVGWFGFYTDYIPEIQSYLLMADGNYIWGPLTASILEKASGGPDWGRRIGVGLVPSAAWIAISLFGIWTIKKYLKMPPAIDYKQQGSHVGYLFFGLMILATNLLVLVALQYHGHTLWKLVYFFFPGARSIRAVARFVIVLALPMAIAFAFLVQHAMQWIGTRKHASTRAWLITATVLVISFGLLEQFNSEDGQYYSISAENARLEKLARKLPDKCSSFYVATAPAVPAEQDSFQNQNYMHDAMLVSILRGVPTLNGRSGKNPPDWSLRNVRAPEYEENVRRWIARHSITGTVCRLVVEN